MEYSEYKTMIEGIVNQPDTIANQAITLLDNLKTDMETMGSLRDQISKQQAKILDLQDTNTKLFLRVTNPVQENSSPPQGDPIENLMKSQFNEGGKPI